MRDKGNKQFLYEVKFIENKKSSQQSMPSKLDSSAPKGDVKNTDIVPQLLKNVNAKDEDFIKYIPRQFFEENIKILLKTKQI